jgi:hypothetical protein
MEKKISLGVFLCLIGVVSLIHCDRQVELSYEDQLIKEFIESQDFQMNDFLSCKSIDYSKSNVYYVNEDTQKPVINIIFSENDQIIGTVEAIKNISAEIKLPNRGQYFMLYRDFQHFNLNELTGSIDLYDLNYDNHNMGIGEIAKGYLIKSSLKPMSSIITLKYEEIISNNSSYLKSKKDEISLNQISKSESVLCDLNENGNVSFSECYKCFNSACGSNETCVVMCFLIGDAMGWSISPAKIPWCQTSIAASCIYISIAY